MLKSQGIGLVVTGISGGGKTSLAAEIMKRHPELHQALRMTVRKPRPGELHLVHYEFVTPVELDELNKSESLLYYENWYGSLYAMRKAPIEERINQKEHVLIETIVPAAFKLYQRSDMKVVFLDTPDESTQVQRLRIRGEEEAWINDRLLYARKERALAKELGVFTVVNNKLEQTVREVEDFFFH